MANIKDVARLAGVSISTVSRVVNNSAGVAENKKEAVLKAMSALNYKPNSFAKALVSRRSNTLGLVVGDLGDPFFALLMKGVENVANTHDRQLLISSGHHNPEQEKRAIRSLIDRHCDAIIVHSKALTDYQVMELLEPQPASVLVNRKIQGLEERCVYLDNYDAGRKATEYLLKSGHRRIAFLSRDTDIDDAVDRCKGYQEALISQGIIPDSQLIIKGQANEEGGYKATMELLERNTEFTAIFAYNDTMAAGCLSALREKKVQVPNDVSVIGFDDVLLASFLNPRLTTVKYPIEAMGESAAKMALQLCDGEDFSPLSNKFDPQLVIRDSVRVF